MSGRLFVFFSFGRKFDDLEKNAVVFRCLQVVPSSV